MNIGASGHLPRLKTHSISLDHSEPLIRFFLCETPLAPSFVITTITQAPHTTTPADFVSIDETRLVEEVKLFPHRLQ